jgi:RNA recognition motif. (a.k.a. RRM, RBD, or RNP domain)
MDKGRRYRRKSRSVSPKPNRRRPSPRRRQRYSSSSLSSTDSEYIETASWLVGRSRTRSPHPWLKQLAGSLPPRKGQESELFWDGFQWVTRSNMASANIDQVLEANRRARRVGLSNLPFEFNISEEDIKNFLNKKMIEYELADPLNANSVLKVWIDDNCADMGVAELSSQDEATRALRLDGILMLGRPLKIARTEEISGINALGEALGINTHILSQNDTVETSAKAAAVAVAAIQDYQGTQKNINIEHSIVKVKYRVVKVSDFLNPREIKRMSDKDFRDIENDMKGEFESFGSVKYCRIVKHSQNKLGAEVGSVFIEFSTPESAENARLRMSKKKFDGKNIRIIEVPDDLFEKELKF